jgi:hypothetical protein
VKWIALLLLVWSGVIVLALLFAGGELPLIACLRPVGPKSADCLELVNAVNDELWRTQQLPRILIAFGGYAMILVYGIWALRARRRRIAW